MAKGEENSFLSKKQVFVSFLIIIAILSVLNYYHAFSSGTKVNSSHWSFLPETLEVDSLSTTFLSLPDSRLSGKASKGRINPWPRQFVPEVTAGGDCQVHFVILTMPERLTYAVGHGHVLLSQGIDRKCLFIAMKNSQKVSSTMLDIEVITVSCPPLKIGLSEKERKVRTKVLTRNITHTYTCVMDAFFERLSNSDPEHTYVSLLEDDLQPSPDFVSSMIWAREVMEMDNTIGAASGWNDNYEGIEPNYDLARKWNGLDGGQWYLMDQFGGLGFLMKLKTWKDIYETISKSPKTWDAAVADHFNTHSLNTLYPEVPRTYHIPFDKGKYMFLLDRPFQLQSQVNYAPPEQYTTDGYGQWIDHLIMDFCTNGNELGTIEELVFYPGIPSQGSKAQWKLVGKNDYPQMVGWGLGNRMRLEWRGTMFVSATTKQSFRSLIVAGYSPHATTLQASCSLGKKVGQRHIIHSSSSTTSVLPYQSDILGVLGTWSTEKKGSLDPLQKPTSKRVVEPLSNPLLDSVALLPYPKVAQIELKQETIMSCWGESATWYMQSQEEAAPGNFAMTLFQNLVSTKVLGPNVQVRRDMPRLSSTDPSIRFQHNSDPKCPVDIPFGENEGFSLQIDSSGSAVVVDITCCAVFGCIQGVRVMGQLVVEHKNGFQYCFASSSLSISDQPAVGYRGLLIDTGRAFFSIGFLQTILDGMHILGLNALHWHLTDDQSFPVEIKKYPQLHQKGANWLGKIHSRCDQPVGSYYTQEQLQMLVEYARIRGIRIIPEIDMPAHSRSWGKGLPEVGCHCPGWVNKRLKVRGQYGINVPLNIFKEETLRVAKDVVSEMAMIFPDPWFHLGGDEVPQQCLGEQPEARSRVKIGLKKAVKVFLEQMVEHLETKHNRKVILWDDMSEMISKNIIHEVWHIHKTDLYLKKKQPVISTGGWYFDVGCKTTSTCHNRPTHLKKVMGAEACAWELTEGACESHETNGDIWERNFHLVVWKKLLGYAEAVWSSETTAGKADIFRANQAARLLERRLGLAPNLIEVS